jgi:hypothetical protein
LTILRVVSSPQTTVEHARFNRSLSSIVLVGNLDLSFALTEWILLAIMRCECELTGSKATPGNSAIPRVFSIRPKIRLKSPFKIGSKSPVWNPCNDQFSANLANSFSASEEHYGRSTTFKYPWSRCDGCDHTSLHGSHQGTTEHPTSCLRWIVIHLWYNWRIGWNRSRWQSQMRCTRVHCASIILINWSDPVIWSFFDQPWGFIPCSQPQHAGSHWSPVAICKIKVNADRQSVTSSSDPCIRPAKVRITITFTPIQVARSTVELATKGKIVQKTVVVKNGSLNSEMIITPK